MSSKWRRLSVLIHALSFTFSHDVPLPIQALPVACELSLSVLLPVALTFSLTILAVANISFTFPFPFPFAFAFALTLPNVPLLPFSFHVSHHYSFFYPGLFAEGWYIIPVAVTETPWRISSLWSPVFRPHRFWYRCLAFPGRLVV